ncbi:MAG TPA: phosphorylase [Burkholderiaceae bacterium]|nr:phosphorylase [Burkholderiaceae bacterium]
MSSVHATETTPFLQQVDARSEAAIASGALQPIESEEVVLDGDGLVFRVRRVKALEKKQALPGGPRDPNFNPFLPPDPALTVGPVGDHHLAILNKYPVSERHLVLARKAYAEQLEPLELCDFEALAEIMAECGGLGFHNGGAPAGASQRHKHVQWVPPAPHNPGLAMFRPVLDPDVREHTVFIHLQLPMQHCFVRVRAGKGEAPELAAQSMLRGYRRALETLRLEANSSGHVPPSNMLVEEGWMLVVPRSQEHFEGVSLNALSFGGVFYVRDEVQLDAMRKAGPLRALTAVSFPV